MTPARGEAGGLSKQRAAERAALLFFTWSVSRTLQMCEAISIVWAEFFNKNLFILKTSFDSTIFIQDFNHTGSALCLLKSRMISFVLVVLSVRLLAEHHSDNLRI